MKQRPNIAIVKKPTIFLARFMGALKHQGVDVELMSDCKAALKSLRKQTTKIIILGESNNPVDVLDKVNKVKKIARENNTKILVSTLIKNSIVAMGASLKHCDGYFDEKSTNPERLAHTIAHQLI